MLKRFSLSAVLFVVDSMKKLKLNQMLPVSLAVTLAVSLFPENVAQAVPVEFRGTVQTDDTTLIQNLPNSNFGEAPDLDVGQFSGVSRRSLLRYSTLAAELAGETVESASLTMTKSSGVNAFGTFASQAIDLYVITPANAGWVEGTGGAGGSIELGSPTWNNLSHHGAITPTNWAGSPGLAAGTDYLATSVGSFIVNSADPIGTSYTVNFADVSFLQDWIDNPSNNGGFFIRWSGAESGNQLFRFFTSSAATESYQPLLSLELAVDLPPDPETSAIPEPASGLMLGLGAMGLIGRARRRKVQA